MFYPPKIKKHPTQFAWMELNNLGCVHWKNHPLLHWCLLYEYWPLTTQVFCLDPSSYSLTTWITKKLHLVFTSQYISLIFTRRSDYTLNGFFTEFVFLQKWRWPWLHHTFFIKTKKRRINLTANIITSKKFKGGCPRDIKHVFRWLSVIILAQENKILASLLWMGTRNCF